MAFMSKIYMLPHEAEPIVRRQLLGVLGQVLLKKQGVEVDTVEAYEKRVARNRLIRMLKAIELKRLEVDAREAMRTVRQALDSWSKNVGFEYIPTSTITFRILSVEAVDGGVISEEPDAVNQETAFLDSVLGSGSNYPEAV